MNEGLSQKYIDRANYIIEHEGLTALLGMKITSFKKGEIIGEIKLEDKHMNFHRGAHGGTLFALADTICGFSVSSMGRSCTTVNSTIDYLRPVMNCEKIICYSKVVKYGRTIAWVDCEIKNEKDVLLSKAHFVYFLLEELTDLFED